MPIIKLGPSGYPPPAGTTALSATTQLLGIAFWSSPVGSTAPKAAKPDHLQAVYPATTAPRTAPLGTPGRHPRGYVAAPMQISQTECIRLGQPIMVPLI